LRRLPYERDEEEREVGPPAAPFESRGAGREKGGVGGVRWRLAEDVASAAEFGNSKRSLLTLSVAGWAVEKLGEVGSAPFGGIRQANACQAHSGLICSRLKI
jgi:hypothetical protein